MIRMDRMRRYLGLDPSTGGKIPFLVLAPILLVTYTLLPLSWWQQLLTAAAAVFVVGLVFGLWESSKQRPGL